MSSQWTDERIDRAVGGIFIGTDDELKRRLMISLAERIRNDMQTQIDDLHRQSRDLMRELASALDVAIARGVTLGYEDADCRERYLDLSGMPWAEGPEP